LHCPEDTLEKECNHCSSDVKMETWLCSPDTIGMVMLYVLGITFSWLPTILQSKFIPEKIRTYVVHGRFITAVGGILIILLTIRMLGFLPCLSYSPKA